MLYEKKEENSEKKESNKRQKFIKISDMSMEKKGSVNVLHMIMVVDSRLLFNLCMSWV